MRIVGLTALALGGMVLLAAPAQARKCRGDAVRVGSACVDKYEASVWEITPANTGLIKSVQKGKIETAADLSGATQRGATADDYGAGCPDTAAGCKDFYAVSVTGVTPARFITWFQAAAACRNANKRLATNQEWQMAAFGTPDPGTDDGTSDCNIVTAGDVTSTGARSLCVSDSGAFDMVGNVWEWVADWSENALSCTDWTSQTGIPGADLSCIGNDGSTAFSRIPGALFRGGYFNDGTGAGVFAVGTVDPSSAASSGSGARASHSFLGLRPVGDLILGLPRCGRA